MRHEATQALYAYWNEIRGTRLAPQRLEIEPQRIGDLLLDSFILERVDGRTYSFRLTGTRLAARFGLDLRELGFLDRFEPCDHGLIEHHLEGVTEKGRVAVFTAEAQVDTSGSLGGSDEAGARSRTLTFEIVVLPLIHTGRSIDRLLCSLVPLDEELTVAKRITGLRLVAAESHLPAIAESYRASLDARQSPLLPHIRNARIVRHGRVSLRVYEGGLTGASRD